jgi:L-rhamnose mutarotase
MERMCFTFDIEAGSEEEYKRRHDEIWPDMAQALRDSGLRNYTLFRRGTTIIGYVECHPDRATAFGAMGATEVNARWSEWFRDIIPALTDEHGELRTFEEVWHQP